MNPVLYTVSVLLFVIATYAVFRLFVRRDYQTKGRLTPLSSLLQLAILGLYFSFPYLYNPVEWAWFWSAAAPVGEPLRIAGVLCIVLGLALAFGTMFWFDLRRSMGMHVDQLIRSGPYRFTRNPQLVGGALLVIGSVVLWPSWYALGWAALYGFLAHVMVITEEEHLRDVYGQEYADYCAEVPRYLGLPGVRQAAESGRSGG